ncbi:right-handed parallel beta-helix repeat-containing protein [Paenibacillus ginsengarvi]|uniref:Right handed beta helix domain-containing protein n=1 Tax=Paenibacillus ginsengarvi TaxID=400777 RepID=A0A3B0B620_9BACL|nr:right-handed parallel beta-helix repeat-containing protein [Paenibacillus ginsengarvi]RKN66027.1 hypothetical protein D7M11_31625 [Paenibacillus ginsengarvi]
MKSNGENAPAERLLSRRKLLASAGIAGLSLYSGTLLSAKANDKGLGGTVTNAVYGGDPEEAECLLRANGAISVLDYGAIGDGITDDTEAFRDAAQTGKMMIVPKPAVYYKVSGPITLTNSVYGIGTPEVRMEGADGSANKRMFIIQSYRGAALHVSGLHLNGQYTGGTVGEQSHLLRVIDSGNIYVHHNRFNTAYGDCVYFGADYIRPCENVHVYQNEMIGPRRCAVALVSVKKAWVRDNIISDAHDYVATIDIEPNKTSSGTEIVEDIWIEDNVFDCAGIFINTYSPNAGFPNKRLTIRGNQGQSRYFFRSIAGETGNTEDVCIADNEFYGSVGDARMFTSSRVQKGLVIRGNRDYGTGSSGWNISNADNAVVSHNVIDAVRAIAASFRNCNRLLFHGNRINHVYSSYGAVRFAGPETTEGNVVTDNIFLDTDYGLKFETVASRMIVSNNHIDSKRACIQLEATAAGSDIRIFQDNVFANDGVPVGNPAYLLKPMTPEAITKGVSVSWANSVPTSGSWIQGSVVYKTAASSAECMGWICVASGSPGNWEPFGIVGEARVILKSPAGSRYAVTVTDTGELVTSTIV